MKLPVTADPGDIDKKVLSQELHIGSEESLTSISAILPLNYIEGHDFEVVIPAIILKFGGKEVKVGAP
jgi:hypothetical protein